MENAFFKVLKFLTVFPRLLLKFRFHLEETVLGLQDGFLLYGLGFLFRFRDHISRLDPKPLMLFLKPKITAYKPNGTTRRKTN